MTTFKDGSEVVTFKQQIRNTLETLHPIVGDIIKRDVVDEDGDRVLHLTTAIALIKTGIALRIYASQASDVSDEDAINSVVDLTTHVLTRTISDCLGVHMQVESGRVPADADMNKVLADVIELSTRRKETDTSH